MKIEVSNLGALKWAEFTLGDLTIICGGNNTGKTYATYALYGFLALWRRVLPVTIADDKINQLLIDGVVNIDVTEYVAKMPEILVQGCKNYKQQLAVVFATSEEKFIDTDFKVTLGALEIRAREQYNVRFERRISSIFANEQFSIQKDIGSNDITVSLLLEKDKVKVPRNVIIQFIENALKDILFGEHFPYPFVASAERTGINVFRKELDIIKDKDAVITSVEIDRNGEAWSSSTSVYRDYALPIERNIGFVGELSSLMEKSSFIKVRHPEILVEFSNISGGEYIVTQHDELYYIPTGKAARLTMDESSSAVRSLLDIGFYLKHLAKPGDILMVDEPELNLHPENQRKVARLFARLMNIGIKVFITTHSDYIIKELNTLIMLNHDKPHLKMIMKEEGYQQAELIRADQVRVYMAEKDANGFNTLTAADIDPEMGIEARTFDITIDTMNSIQRNIVWGGE